MVPDQILKESPEDDSRIKKWLVCQTGVVAVRVLPQVINNAVMAHPQVTARGCQGPPTGMN